MINQQDITNFNIEKQKISRLLNINLSKIAGNPVIVSVGSPKLLIEVDSLDTLYALQPNLELINAWSKENLVNGCYVYCKLTGNSYSGRNFNHLDPLLEDSATGVAAGAITAYVKCSINLHQGYVTNNPCIIHTKFINNKILIGGTVTSY